MSEWTAKAAALLEDECKSGKFDKYGSAMKEAVQKALLDFCRQDDEFAQAVVQGGSFTDCMTAVGKKSKTAAYPISMRTPLLSAFTFPEQRSALRCASSCASMTGMRYQGTVCW